MNNNYVGQFSISRGEKCERKMEEATYFMNDSGWELFFLLLRSYVFYERIRGWKLFFLLYKKLRILWTTPGMRTLLPIVCCWPSRRWPHSTNHSSRQRAYTYVHTTHPSLKNKQINGMIVKKIHLRFHCQLDIWWNFRWSRLLIILTEFFKNSAGKE